MMRCLILTLVLTGCTIGSTGSELIQARGATVAIAVRMDGRQQILAGELLAVETDSLLIDSVDAFGQPQTVVRVAKGSVTRGAVYVGTSPGADLRSVRRPPPGMRRVAKLDPGDDSMDRPLLVRLSRFPGGLSGDLLSRLLAARGQSEVGDATTAVLLDAPR